VGDLQVVNERRLYGGELGLVSDESVLCKALHKCSMRPDRRLGERMVIGWHFGKPDEWPTHIDMKNAHVIIFALMVAPLFAGVGYELVFFANHPNDFMKLWEQNKALPMLLPNLYVTPISYAGTLVFGLPAYLLLLRYRLTKFYHVVGAGGVCGLMVFWVLRVIIGKSLGDDVLFTVVPGMIVAACASLIVNLFSVQEDQSRH
jgi:hypothetical protein